MSNTYYKPVYTRPKKAFRSATTDELEVAVIELDKRVHDLKEDIAEAILLSDADVAVSVYDMSYEEYAELPGDVRL